VGTIVRLRHRVVMATGSRTALGRIAVSLATASRTLSSRWGLRRFSLMLAWVASVSSPVIFVIILLLDRPLIGAVLFSVPSSSGTHRS
jgi:magnesium-transporting ATPase (P-type)